MKLNQFKKNIISGSVIQTLNVLVIFIAYPIYINYLGFELFSIWILLSVVISFGMMGELGISNAITTFTAKAKAKEDHQEIRKILYNSLFIVSVPSVIILFILWTFNDNIIYILEIPAEHHDISIAILPFIGISIVIYLFHDVFSGIITGMGRLDISYVLLFARNLLKTIISIILLSLGYSLFSMIYGILVANILIAILKVIIIKVSLGTYVLKPIRLSIENIKRLLNFGFTMIGMQLFNMLSIPFIKVVLAKSVGVEAVGIFELAQKAGYGIRTVFQKGLFAFLPEIAYVANKHRYVENIRTEIYGRVIKYSMYLLYYAVPFFIVLSLTASIWLNLWLGESYNENVLYGFWLLQPGIIASLLILPSFYSLMATNNQRYCFYESVLRVIIIFLLSILYILYDAGIHYAFVIVSISVVTSNLFVFKIFQTKFK